MTQEQEFVLSLYPESHAVLQEGRWYIRDMDGTNLSIGWCFGKRNRKAEEFAWKDAAESLNYEILRKLES